MCMKVVDLAESFSSGLSRDLELHTVGGGNNLIHLHIKSLASSLQMATSRPRSLDSLEIDMFQQHAVLCPFLEVHC